MFWYYIIGCPFVCVLIVNNVSIYINIKFIIQIKFGFDLYLIGIFFKNVFYFGKRCLISQNNLLVNDSSMSQIFHFFINIKVFKWIVNQKRICVAYFEFLVSLFYVLYSTVNILLFIWYIQTRVLQE